MLIAAATEAGMKTPPDPNNYEPEDFPHFSVFCYCQLARRMTSSHEHWENAEVIAAIPEDRIRWISLKELIELGFMGLD